MIFCKTLKAKFRNKPFRKLVGDYTFTLYTAATDIPSHWDDVLNGANFFLSTAFLGLLEKLHADQFSSRYIIVYDKGKPVFVAYFQIIDFSANVFGEMMNNQINELRSHRAKMFEHYLETKNSKKKDIVMRLVTCGNNFISGEHAFYSAVKDQTQTSDILEEVLDIISKEEKLRGKISATLVKDFESEKVKKRPVLSEDKFLSFLVEPNLIIDVPEGLTSVKAYLDLFSKKYRNRAKAIFKAGAALRKKDLTVDEIANENDQLHKYYTAVYSNAKFKLVKCSKDYFLKMKETFPEHFFVTGYYIENKLVGFDSWFLCNDGLIDAHYIGFDYELNKELEIYQNILYHFIELAIEKKSKTINLGRTAAEIKTTVGAKPHDLICYIKPQNTISKLILKPFISFFQPAAWIPRNPFKEE